MSAGKRLDRERFIDLDRRATAEAMEAIQRRTRMAADQRRTTEAMEAIFARSQKPAGANGGD